MGFDDPVAELLLVQSRVEAAVREELVVGAALDDRAVLDGEDDIGVSDRREAVRAGDRGSALDEGLECLLDDALALGVQCVVLEQEAVRRVRIELQTGARDQAG